MPSSASKNLFQFFIELTLCPFADAIESILDPMFIYFIRPLSVALRTSRFTPLPLAYSCIVDSIPKLPLSIESVARSSNGLSIITLSAALIASSNFMVAVTLVAPCTPLATLLPIPNALNGAPKGIYVLGLNPISRGMLAHNGKSFSLYACFVAAK